MFTRNKLCTEWDLHSFRRPLCEVFFDVNHLSYTLQFSVMVLLHNYFAVLTATTLVTAVTSLASRDVVQGTQPGAFCVPDGWQSGRAVTLAVTSRNSAKPIMTRVSERHRHCGQTTVNKKAPIHYIISINDKFYRPF